MTEIYLMRHAQPDWSVHDEYSRPLTERGRADRDRAYAYLEDKGIEVVVSSPYLRAMDTVAPFAAARGIKVEKSIDMRERRVDSLWLTEEEMNRFIRAQWDDHEHRLTDGESLREAQERCIAALKDILHRHANKKVLIGGHGTAFSTILNYYCPEFGYVQHQHILKFLPFVVRMKFFEEELLELEIIDPLAYSEEPTAPETGVNRLTLVEPKLHDEPLLMDYRQEFMDWEEYAFGACQLCRFSSYARWREMYEESMGGNAAEMYMGIRREDGTLVGTVTIRRTIDEKDTTAAGNISMSVRRSERGKGHGTELLSLALERCRKLGMQRVLLTCDIENAAAKGTIKACGGMLHSMIIMPVSSRYPGGLVCRYTIDL
ncbi:MAG: GNAT family N-acetyltransferase [Ruminococcaceae bacterium]|nr:GNAT family N-acetyltransferase [Oscillospiraceae bacterium]